MWSEQKSGTRGAAECVTDVIIIIIIIIKTLFYEGNT